MFPDKNQNKSEKQFAQKVRVTDERLDEIALWLVRAAEPAEEKINAIVSAPFLYARLQSRIKAQQEKLASGGVNNLWAMLLTAWRPLAGMALMAMVAIALFWFTALAGTSATDSLISGNDYLAAGGGSSFERIVFTEKSAPSNDEVLTTLLSQDETDVQK